MTEKIEFACSAWVEKARQRQKPAASTPAEPAIDQVLPSAPLTWAERLKRVFDIDISVNAV
jgi:hypothetical protein